MTTTGSITSSPDSVIPTALTVTLNTLFGGGASFFVSAIGGGGGGGGSIFGGGINSSGVSTGNEYINDTAPPTDHVR